jgi:micrococcal nuclease
MKYEYACQVYNVVDGDTVDCVIDLGFRINIASRVRLWGLNAAELKTGESGLSAQSALRLLMIGKPLRIKTLKDGADKYGRMLGIFYEANSERSINQKMLDQKMAVPFMVKMNGDKLPEV